MSDATRTEGVTVAAEHTVYRLSQTGDALPTHYLRDLPDGTTTEPEPGFQTVDDARDLVDGWMVPHGRDVCDRILLIEVPEADHLSRGWDFFPVVARCEVFGVRRVWLSDFDAWYDGQAEAEIAAWLDAHAEPVEHTWTRTVTGGEMTA